MLTMTGKSRSAVLSSWHTKRPALTQQCRTKSSAAVLDNDHHDNDDPLHNNNNNTIPFLLADIGEGIERHLSEAKGKPVPMNIDGATAVIFAELGFDAPLARGLFCLSRSVGILAHAWEQKQQGGRNKGPTPPQYRWTYSGD